MPLTTLPMSILPLCTLLLLLLSTTALAGKNRVIGVLFVEKDTSSNKKMRDAVLHQLRFVQREFLRNFGKTFALDANPVKVVRADHTGYWYVNTRSSDIRGNTQIPRWYRLENVREEVVRKLRLGPDIRLLVYPTSRRNGMVGAYINEPIGQGGYMDFDDITCVYGAGESTPYTTSEAVCGAHELHEMGHIFGLKHEGPRSDCMQLGFYKRYAPNGGVCTFSQANRNKVLSTQQAWLTVKSISGGGGGTTGGTKTCTFRDKCNKSIKHTASLGKTYRDSCGRYYRVFYKEARKKCARKRVCVYTDACDKTKQIVARPKKTFVDECKLRYRVSTDCSLSRI